MSSFNAIPFRMEPEGSGFFPQFVRANDETRAYFLDCTVVIEGRSNLNSMLGMLSVGTVKRPRGTLGIVVHIEAGTPAPSALIYPSKSGTSKTIQALLWGIDRVQVYGRPTGGGTKNEQYELTLKFLATGNPAS
jgi:hypothetical protein